MLVRLCGRDLYLVEKLDEQLVLNDQTAYTTARTRNRYANGRPCDQVYTATSLETLAGTRQAAGMLFPFLRIPNPMDPQQGAGN